MNLQTEKYNVGVIVGRFQVHELHSAHKELIQTVINNHPKVLIFLGISPVIPTQRDPLDFVTRKMMIEETFPSDNVTVLPIVDKNNDNAWSNDLDSKISEAFMKETVVLYGSRDSFIPHYKGIYPTRVLEPTEYVSGTDIRETLSHRVISDKNFRAGAIYTVNQMFPLVYSTVDAAIIKFKKEGNKIIRNGEHELLLGQKLYEDRWRFVGGFIDPTDLTDEMAVKREVMEETGGIEVGYPKYVTSMQIDDWRYRNQIERKIMTRLFLCDYLYGSPKPSDDIHKLRWFTLHELENDDSMVVDGHRELLEKLFGYLENKNLF